MYVLNERTEQSKTTNENNVGQHRTLLAGRTIQPR